MKTEHEIKTDIWRLLKSSALAKTISGTVSKTGRHAGSRLEDVVVSVLSSVMIGQSQEVYVNVNIYVSDVMRGEAYEENSLRLAELSRLAYEVLNAGNVDGFRITLAEQKTYDVAGLNEHMINNKVLYQYCNE